MLLIVAISTSAGFFVSRAGARRSFLILGIGFLAMASASLLTSRYLTVDILFAPMALGAMGAFFLVQLHRLSRIDSLLTHHVTEIPARAETTEVPQPHLPSRLQPSHTPLPLDT